jgi:hypothetical protein
MGTRLREYCLELIELTHDREASFCEHDKEHNYLLKAGNFSKSSTNAEDRIPMNMITSICIP